MGRPIPRNLQAAHDKKWIPKSIGKGTHHREKYRALLDAGWTILHSGSKSDCRVGYYAPNGVGFDSLSKAWAAHEAGKTDKGVIREYVSEAGMRLVRTELNGHLFEKKGVKERPSQAGLAAVRTPLNAAAIDAGELKERASTAGKRPSEAGKCNPANQRRSWAAAAARGTGETQDGLSPQEREDMAQQVAGEVNAVAIAALDHSGSTSVYVAVGSHRRMVTNPGRFRPR